MINAPMSLEEFARIYQEMGMDEPFIYSWFESGSRSPVGLVVGWLKFNERGERYLDVSSMIVRPHAKRKFRVMMAMSEAATQMAFRECGCMYVLISILRDNPRRRALEGWADRMQYVKYASDDVSDWYCRADPTPVYKETYGQGQSSTDTEDHDADSGSAR